MGPFLYRLNKIFILNVALDLIAMVPLCEGYSPLVYEGPG